METPARSAPSPFLFQVADLAGRPGQHRQVTATFEVPENIGTPVIAVPEGSAVELVVSFEVVTDGVWASGNFHGVAHGECGRCLDKVVQDIAVPIQGLFLYPEHHADADDSEDVYAFDGAGIDVAGLVRDAVITVLPFTPLCSSDCPGLCDQCGARLADDPGHVHEVVDPRWSTLRSLLGEDSSPEKKES